MKAVCPAAFSNDASPKEQPSVVSATLKLALTAYSTAIEATLKATLAAAIGITGITAGWCRLKPVLKAPGYNAGN